MGVRNSSQTFLIALLFRFRFIYVSSNVFSRFVIAFSPFPQSARRRRPHHQSSLWSTATSTTCSPETVAKDDYDLVCYYTERAITFRGQPEGVQALEDLAKFSQQRVSYEFLDQDENVRLQKKHITEGSTVKLLPELLSQKQVDEFLKQVQIMETNGWLSTNPDSVDGLPSLHLNLIVNGDRHRQPKNDDDDDDEEEEMSSPSEYQKGVQKLIDIVRPALYDVLLPRVNEALNTTSITISEVFLRRYGSDICGELTRNGISAHYDVFSRVTAVIALDDVAADGSDGLFTSFLSSSSSSSSSSSLPPSSSKKADTVDDTSIQQQQPQRTSNHAALRRFFPLRRGDSVVHTWDVLHGVDVRPGLDRTSLIVWFTEKSEKPDNEEQSPVAQWLLDDNGGKLETSDVKQFVLASALSSVQESGYSAEELESLVSSGLSEQYLFLKSAAQGNTFALTRMGSIIEEGSLQKDLEIEAVHVVETLRALSDLPDPIANLPNPSSLLSARFWLEGALRGSPLAQIALADELMVEATNSGDEDTRLLAAVLFALAAQQGNEQGAESLSKVVQYDVGSRGIDSEAEFLASPVVQTAQAAMSEVSD